MFQEQFSALHHIRLWEVPTLIRFFSRTILNKKVFLPSILIVSIGKGLQVDFSWFRIHPTMQHVVHLEMLSEKHPDDKKKRKRENIK